MPASASKSAQILLTSLLLMPLSEGQQPAMQESVAALCRVQRSSWAVDRVRATTW